jgi:hypothetical protein
MADISHTTKAKSDQLNAADIQDATFTIKVRAVNVTNGEQPVSIFYDGDNGKPYKPSKNMRRLLAVGWSNESDNWIGKHIELCFDPHVKYAGQEVGGIKISGMSDIKKDFVYMYTENRSKRTPMTVKLLKIQEKPYPEDRFSKALPVMIEKMQSGEFTLQQIIAQCQKTGQLSAEQLKQLEENAPVIIDEDQE